MLKMNHYYNRHSFYNKDLNVAFHFVFMFLTQNLMYSLLKLFQHSNY